jgi:hypothetical protein
VQSDVERLPSFITGGQGGQPQHQGNGQNGHEGGHRSDRYPLHRRRRPSRGPRNEASSPQGADDTTARPPSE